MAKILVTMDEKVLARVDRAARARGLSRSAYLERLAVREVGGHGPGRRGRVKRALARLDGVFAASPQGEDSTVAVRAERDAR